MTCSQFRLVDERNQDFLEASYHYDPAGRLLDRILSNGSKTAYTYDADNRLLSLKNTTANDTVINNTTYVRDRLGNITSQTDASGETTFTYDALYRLTGANYPGTTNDQSFTYDHVGNRKTKVQNGVTLAYIYDAGNRLKEIRQGSDTGPIQNSFVYDDDGNMIQKRNGGGTPIQTITYDAKGRAKTITTNGVDTALTYDPYDYRIGKTDTTGTRRYLLEGEHLEATLDGSNNWKAMYLRGAVIDEIVNAYYFDTNNRWANYTFHHDALQSVLGISGHEGSALQTITYGPFGEKIGVTGSAPNNYLHFTGREEDPDTGLYYFRDRYADLTVGGFISEDRKAFEAGVNFYSYCNGDPINTNDPYGMLAEKLIANIVKYGGRLGSKETREQVVQIAEEWIAKGWELIGGGGKLKEWYLRPPTGGRKGAAYTDLSLQKGEEIVHLNTVDTLADGVTMTAREARNLNKIQTTLDPKSNVFAIPKQKSATGLFGAIMAGDFDEVKSSIMNIGEKVIDFALDMIIPGGITEMGNAELPSNYSSMFPSTISGAAGTSSSGYGGFVIYPNKPNTNMMRSVYSK